MLDTTISSGAAQGILSVVVYNVTDNTAVYSIAPTNVINMNNVRWEISGKIYGLSGKNYEVCTQQVSAGITVSFSAGTIAVTNCNSRYFSYTTATYTLGNLGSFTPADFTLTNRNSTLSVTGNTVQLLAGKAYST